MAAGIDRELLALGALGPYKINFVVFVFGTGLLVRAWFRPVINGLLRPLFGFLVLIHEELYPKDDHQSHEQDRQK